MLNSEVIDAVREGKFSIWAVNNIDDGIELLTGVSAGRLRKDNSYTDGSVHGLVKSRLKKMLSDGMRLEKRFGHVPRKRRKKNTASSTDNDNSKDTPSS